MVRDFIGGTRYSGSGGLLSDDDPTLGIVDGVIFRLDLAKHTYQPLEIMGGSPDPKPGHHALFAINHLGIAGSFGNGYHFVSEASGKPVAYFVEAAGHICAVFMKRGPRWLCVAALGRGDSFQWPNDFPKPPKPHAIWAWNDQNGDGYQSPDEVTWHDPGRTTVFQHKTWGYRCGKDLTFRHSGLAFAPVRFTADGAPVYDPSKPKKLPGELGESLAGEVYKTRFGYFTELNAAGKYEASDSNNVVHGLGLLTGFDANGRKVWSFPNYWRNVHGAMTAPIAVPGIIMGALKVTGVFPLTVDGKDTGHDVVAIRGNIGQEFLIRDDGLYLGELFTDQRMAPSSLPAERDPVKLLGVPINDTTLGGEPFNGWIGRQSDGKVRMTYGYTDVRIAEVVGLDSVRDLPALTISLDAAGVAKAKAFVPRVTVADDPKDWIIPRGSALSLDPETRKDAKAISIRSGREEVGKAWLTYDDTNLYLAVQAFDATPLKNTGTDPITAFKTGDGVDLFVAADGATTNGTRVLMTVQNGKPVAVVYRPEGPGDKPFVFKSPVRTVTFRYAAVEPRVTVAAQAFGTPATPRDSMLTATIPWAVLGIKPKAGLVLKGDVGLLLSDDTGTTTAQRVRWSDRETNVVNDLPTEAEFSRNGGGLCG